MPPQCMARSAIQLCDRRLMLPKDLSMCCSYPHSKKGKPELLSPQMETSKKLPGLAQHNASWDGHCIELHKGEDAW